MTVLKPMGLIKSGVKSINQWYIRQGPSLSARSWFFNLSWLSKQNWLQNDVNSLPLPSGRGKNMPPTLCIPWASLFTHWPHYATLRLHYAALRPTAVWQHDATQGSIMCP